MTFVERCRNVEAQILSRPPEVQAALISVAVALVKGLSGKVPAEDLMLVVDLLQNAGGKVQRGLADEASIMAQLIEGMPTIAGKFLAELQAA